MPVKFDEIQLAFEFASFGEPGESEAYLCRHTSKVYLRSDSLGDIDEEQIPEDIDDEDKYIQIPHKKQLDLGKPLVFEFAGELLPNDFDEVRDIFRRRGAYGRFKNLLVRRGALERWYDFAAKAEESALRDWCEANSIEIIE
jgi:hypothetical protein